MNVLVRDQDGNPICFICATPVAKAGEACSRSCYAHFLVAVSSSPGPIQMENLVDMESMSWYGLDDDFAS